MIKLILEIGEVASPGSMRRQQFVLPRIVMKTLSLTWGRVWIRSFALANLFRFSMLPDAGTSQDTAPSEAGNLYSVDSHWRLLLYVIVLSLFDLALTLTTVAAFRRLIL